jgi:hypothetical protein
MKLLGANPKARAEGAETLPGRVNYLLGRDAASWKTDVPTFARVRYASVYPGVDLVYHGNSSAGPRGKRQLEFDFVLAPGADPHPIRIGFEGARDARVSPEGDLILSTACGEVRQHRPVVYQEVDGRRAAVAGSYVLRTAPSGGAGEWGSGGPGERGLSPARQFPHSPPQIAFQLARYDRTRPLIIDPVLEYSTLLGGSAGNAGTDFERAQGIAVDAEGSAYVTGATLSPDFPVETPFQATKGEGGANAFVTKLSPDGSTVLYSTYLGGKDPARHGDDFAYAIAVDAGGNAWVTGKTTSSDFPTTRGALRTTPAGDPGGTDAFVAKLGPAGDRLLYSTYLGGGNFDEGTGVAVDATGSAYVTGRTNSENTASGGAFPTTAGAFQRAFGGGRLQTDFGGDAFVTKLAATGAMVYSTYLGGIGADQAYAIAVDTAGSAYVTGFTTGDFRNAGPTAGGVDAFVAKLNARGSGLAYFRYLGGSNDDLGHGIAVDAKGNAYVSGSTLSQDFPTTKGAFQRSFGGGSAFGGDLFVSKVNPAGSALVYATYLGGTGGDGFNTFLGAEGGSNLLFVSNPGFSNNLAVDGSGNAYVTGKTISEDFPVRRAVQDSRRGGSDALVTKLNPAGSALVYSTYLGGDGNDQGLGIAVDTKGNAYVAGETLAPQPDPGGGAGSTDFPRTARAFQKTRGGDVDAFVAKISDVVAPPRRLVVSPRTLNFGSVRAGKVRKRVVTISNVGRQSLTVSVAALSAPLSVFSGGGDFVLARGKKRRVTVRFAPTAAGGFTQKLVITSSDPNLPRVEVRVVGHGAR